MKLLSGLQQNKAVFACLFLLAGLYSCEKKDISFGQDLTESYTHLTVIDTITPYLATYKLDSFPTSGTNVVLTGSYKDSIFGNISCKSFFQLNPPATVPDVPEDAIFDSLNLILTLNKGYYGDTTTIQQINVHEINTKVELPGSATSFYNTNSFPYNTDALGSISTIIRPNKTDTLSIRLPNAKGAALFGMLQQKTTEITDATAFQEYLKGLVLVPGNLQSTAVYGINASDSTISMRVYYREKGIILVNKYIDFKYAANGLQFNQVSINRSGTVLGTLPSNNPEIASGLLRNAAYVQPATGLMAKVRFPTLRNLLLLNNYGKILKAELIIRPVSNSFNDIYRLPPNLVLVTTNKYNASGAVITNTATGGSQYGNLFIDNVYGEETNYTFDVTSFMQSEISTDINAENGLLIYTPTPAYTSSLNRLVMGNSANPKGSIQLKLYYLAID